MFGLILTVASDMLSKTSTPGLIGSEKKLSQAYWILILHAGESREELNTLLLSLG